MSKTLSGLEYEIIDITKYDSEPFSMVILSSLLEKYSLEAIIEAIGELLEQKYLKAFVGNDEHSLTKQDLIKYIERRREAGEELTEYPIICPDYFFAATNLGISQLNEKDKRKDAESKLELWRNKKTGEELEVHVLNPDPRNKHPHPKETGKYWENEK